MSDYVTTCEAHPQRYDATIRRLAERQELIPRRRRKKWYFSNFKNVLISREQGLDDANALAFLVERTTATKPIPAKDAKLGGVEGVAWQKVVGVLWTLEADEGDYQIQQLGSTYEVFYLGGSFDTYLISQCTSLEEAKECCMEDLASRDDSEEYAAVQKARTTLFNELCAMEYDDLLSQADIVGAYVRAAMVAAEVEYDPDFLAFIIDELEVKAVDQLITKDAEVTVLAKVDESTAPPATTNAEVTVLTPSPAPRRKCCLPRARWAAHNATVEGQLFTAKQRQAFSQRRTTEKTTRKDSQSCY